MVYSLKRAKKLANRILRENRKGRSYRVIAREDYPLVKAGTLNRIAKSKGEWMPTRRDILIVLGLCKPKVKKSKPIRPDYVLKFHHLPLDEKYKVYKDYIEWKEKNVS